MFRFSVITIFWIRYLCCLAKTIFIDTDQIDNEGITIMRIKKLILNEKDLKDSGLKSIDSVKIGSLVALVGKNGSGKTRFLKAIERKLNNIELIDVLEECYEYLPSQIYSYKQKYSQSKETYASYLKLIEAQEQQKKTPNDEALKQHVADLRNDYENKSKHHKINVNTLMQTSKYIQKEVKKRVKIIKHDDLRALKATFDSKEESVLSFEDIIESTNGSIEVNEFSMISNSALKFLRRLPHKLNYDDIETRGNIKKFRARVSHKRYMKLKGMIQSFLGKKLDWGSRRTSIDEHDDHINIKATGYWTLDGREFNYNDLSEGEKVLFAYALLLFLLDTNPRVNFKDSIIVIDEPELNLHPKAQIHLIESLKDLVQETGQLFIATHSLPIVANLDYGAINLVRDSEWCTPSSVVPFHSIDELMGFDEHYNTMVEFLVSPPSWAMTRFMAQCFEKPEVFEVASNNDPQRKVFSDLIQGDPITILDFGAGKGRLLDAVFENEGTKKRITAYDCFDVDTANNDLLKKKGARKVLNVLEDIDKEKYDLIVMVNVLHEISIKHWKETLNTVKSALTFDGYLAIVEDTELPIGELPNENGFLLLGKEEFKILLGDKTSFITPDTAQYKNRIICSLVHRGDIAFMTNNILIKTLETLKMNSLKSIKDFRKQPSKDVKLGRLYALKANLFVNAELSLKWLYNEKS